MTRTSQRSTLLLGGLAVAALSFTACGGSDDGGGGDVAAFCETYLTYQNDETLGDGGSGEVIDALKDVRGLAPSEIKDEFGTLISSFEVLDAFNTKFEAGEEVDQDDPALITASEELDVAGEAVDEFVAENCDVVPGS